MANSKVTSRGAAAPAKIVTLRDVARAAGVSAQTVSCVVNERGSISNAVRETVRRIADELGYIPNKSAQFMRTGRNRAIGLVIADIRRPFFPELAHYVQKAAFEARYAVLMVDTSGPEQRVAEHLNGLKGHGVDGILTTEDLDAVYNLGLPTIMIGHPIKGTDSVTSDDVEGGQMTAAYLRSLGHVRVGMITSPKPGCIEIRRNSFRETFPSMGEVVWEMYTPPDEAITDEIVARVLAAEVTAIVCSHDLIAIDLMRRLEVLGFFVPRDVSLIGFDDVQWASVVRPGLTTIQQPYEGLGGTAVELLLERIENPGRRSRRIKLPVTLVERQTVKAQAGMVESSRAATDPIRQTV
jgi:LacI family transcriptional regulator